MNGHEKSDPIVVATKPANKAGRPVAERVERRVGTKGNAGQHNTRRAQNRESVTQALAQAHGGHWLPQELQARQQGLRRGQASLGQQLERLTDAYLAGVVRLDEY